MNGAFYIGATGLDAQQRALDVIANNLANLNTPAFKRSSVRFSELASPRSEQTDLAPSDPQAWGSLTGVSLDPSAREFAQGELKPTGRPLDLAISGEGFIELLGPGGQVLLSRGGSLKVNGDGYLAAANGMPLKAMIAAPADATDLTIGPDGSVQATLPGETKPTELGRIELVRAKDMASLTPAAEGLYQPASESELIAAAPGEDGAGMLAPGSLEQSNVQMTDEMVMLMVLQRAYAANAQVVQAGDQLMSIANNLRR